MRHSMTTKRGCNLIGSTAVVLLCIIGLAIPAFALNAQTSQNNASAGTRASAHHRIMTQNEVYAAADDPTLDNVGNTDGGQGHHHHHGHGGGNAVGNTVGGPGGGNAVGNTVGGPGGGNTVGNTIGGGGVGNVVGNTVG